MEEMTERAPLLQTSPKVPNNLNYQDFTINHNEVSSYQKASTFVSQQPIVDSVNEKQWEEIPLEKIQEEEKFNDPFMQQLPRDILRYIKSPNNAEIPFVKHTSGEKVGRGFLTVLTLPYAALKSQLVREGEICLTWNGDKPEILGPGRHVLFKPTNTVHTVRSLSEPLIQHGPISIIRVAVGQLAYGFDSDTGNPVLLSPGRHVINSATFKFQRFLDLSQPVNELGSLKLVRVDTGKVGVCYLRTGELKILQPGIHLITPPDRFDRLLSTQMEILPLPKSIFENSNYVGLEISADVFYKIEDPKKVCTNVSDIKKSITDVAIATLSNIIRSSSLDDIGQSSKQSYKKNTSQHKLKKEPDLPPTAPSFYTRVHDEFISELHDHYFEHWGVSIENIRIESLKIDDDEIAKGISGQALTYAKVQTELSNAQYQTQIKVAESDREANSLRIKTDAESLAIERKAEANAKALLTDIKAKNEAAMLEAETKAKTIGMLAKAKFEAQKLEAEGRAYYAQKMKEVGPVGEQIALYDAQTATFGNVQKMVYVPSNFLPGFFNAAFSDLTLKQALGQKLPQEEFVYDPNNEIPASTTLKQALEQQPQEKFVYDPKNEIPASKF